MIDWDGLRDQTVTFRRAIQRAVSDEGKRAGVIPPTWNNNLHWQVGHLAVTARGLTRGLMREPLGIDDAWRRAFSKGTSPADWTGLPPAFDEVVQDLVESIPPLFDEFESRQDEAFPEPYTTSAGVTLHTPAEAMSFSFVHDGVHLGSILALKRGLAAMEAGV